MSNGNGFDDEFEIPLDGLDVENLSGFARLAGGSYHAKIIKIDPSGGDKGEMIVDMEILAGTSPNQEGKVHREYFTRDMKDANRRKVLAMLQACGAVSKADLAAAKAAGVSPKPNIARGVGAHVCFNAEQSEWPVGSGKYKTRFVWSEVYSVSDPKAAGIPKHVGMLNRDGITLPPNLIPNMNVKAGAPTQQQPPKTNPVTGAVAGQGHAGQGNAAPSDVDLSGVV